MKRTTTTTMILLLLLTFLLLVLNLNFVVDALGFDCSDHFPSQQTLEYDGSDITHTSTDQILVTGSSHCKIVIKNFNIAKIVVGSVGSILSSDIEIRDVTCNMPHNQQCITFETKITRSSSTHPVNNITLDNVHAIIPTYYTSSPRTQISLLRFSHRITYFGSLIVKNSKLTIEQNSDTMLYPSWGIYPIFFRGTVENFGTLRFENVSLDVADNFRAKYGTLDMHMFRFDKSVDDVQEIIIDNSCAIFHNISAAKEIAGIKFASFVFDGGKNIDFLKISSSILKISSANVLKSVRNVNFLEIMNTRNWTNIEIVNNTLDVPQLYFSKEDQGVEYESHIFFIAMRGYFERLHNFLCEKNSMNVFLMSPYSNGSAHLCFFHSEKNYAFDPTVKKFEFSVKNMSFVENDVSLETSTVSSDSPRYNDDNYNNSTYFWYHKNTRASFFNVSASPIKKLDILNFTSNSFSFSKGSGSLTRVINFEKGISDMNSLIIHNLSSSIQIHQVFISSFISIIYAQNLYNIAENVQISNISTNIYSTNLNYVNFTSVQLWIYVLNVHYFWSKATSIQNVANFNFENNQLNLQKNISVGTFYCHLLFVSRDIDTISQNDFSIVNNIINVEGLVTTRNTNYILPIRFSRSIRNINSGKFLVQTLHVKISHQMRVAVGGDITISMIQMGSEQQNIKNGILVSDIKIFEDENSLQNRVTHYSQNSNNSIDEQYNITEAVLYSINFIYFQILSFTGTTSLGTSSKQISSVVVENVNISVTNSKILSESGFKFWVMYYNNKPFFCSLLRISDISINLSNVSALSLAPTTTLQFYVLNLFQSNYGSAACCEPQIYNMIVTRIKVTGTFVTGPDDLEKSSGGTATIALARIFFRPSNPLAKSITFSKIYFENISSIAKTSMSTIWYSSNGLPIYYLKFLDIYLLNLYSKSQKNDGGVSVFRHQFGHGESNYGNGKINSVVFENILVAAGRSISAGNNSDSGVGYDTNVSVVVIRTGNIVYINKPPPLAYMKYFLMKNVVVKDYILETNFGGKTNSNLIFFDGSELREPNVFQIQFSRIENITSRLFVGDDDGNNNVDEKIKNSLGIPLGDTTISLFQISSSSSSSGLNCSEINCRLKFLNNQILNCRSTKILGYNFDTDFEMFDGSGSSSSLQQHMIHNHSNDNFIGTRPLEISNHVLLNNQGFPTNSSSQILLVVKSCRSFSGYVLDNNTLQNYTLADIPLSIVLETTTQNANEKFMNLLVYFKTCLGISETTKIKYANFTNNQIILPKSYSRRSISGKGAGAGAPKAASPGTMSGISTQEVNRINSTSFMMISSYAMMSATLYFSFEHNSFSKLVNGSFVLLENGRYSLDKNESLFIFKGNEGILGYDEISIKKVDLLLAQCHSEIYNVATDLNSNGVTNYFRGNAFTFDCNHFCTSGVEKFDSSVSRFSAAFMDKPRFVEEIPCPTDATSSTSTTSTTETTTLAPTTTTTTPTATTRTNLPAPTFAPTSTSSTPPPATPAPFPTASTRYPPPATVTGTTPTTTTNSSTTTSTIIIISPTVTPEPTPRKKLSTTTTKPTTTTTIASTSTTTPKTTKISTKTKTISLSIQPPIPIPEPYVKEVPSALIAASNAGGVVSGSSVIAPLAMRNVLLLVSQSCGTDPSENELDVASNPTRIVVGNDSLRYFRGVLIGNGIILGSSLALLILALFVQKIRDSFCSSSENSENNNNNNQQQQIRFLPKVVNVKTKYNLLTRFITKLIITTGTLWVILAAPSTAAFVALAAYQDYSSTSSTENFTKSKATEFYLITFLLGTVEVLVPLIVITCVCFYVRNNKNKDLSLERVENQKGALNWWFGAFRGLSFPDTLWVKRVGFLFERSESMMYVLGEYLVSVIVSSCVGLTQTSSLNNTQCGIIAITMFVIQIPPFLYVIIAKPLLTRFDIITTLLMTSVNLVTSLIGLISYFKNDFRPAQPLMIVSYVAAAANIASAIAFLSYFFRSSLLKEIFDKKNDKRRRNGGDNNGDDDQEELSSRRLNTRWEDELLRNVELDDVVNREDEEEERMRREAAAADIYGFATSDGGDVGSNVFVTTTDTTATTTSSSSTGNRNNNSARNRTYNLDDDEDDDDLGVTLSLLDDDDDGDDLFNDLDEQTGAATNDELNRRRQELGKLLGVNENNTTSATATTTNNSNNVNTTSYENDDEEIDDLELENFLNDDDDGDNSHTML